MEFKLTKKLFIILETVFIGICALVVYGFIKILMPEHYFEFYPFIPIYFLIFGIYSIFMFDKCREQTPNKILTAYLGIKFSKLLLSIIVLLFYTLKVDKHDEDFVLVFFLFYLLTLIFHSTLFILYELSLKRNKKNKK